MKTKDFSNQINFAELQQFLLATARLVVKEIRNNRTFFEQKIKNEVTRELVTDVDIRCQELWITACQKKYPFVAIIAEEKSPSLLPVENFTGHLYFTIDPLDGTAAFTRGQSDGFGTMVSLFFYTENSEPIVLASCVVDATTQEMYYADLNTTTPLRIDFDGTERILRPNTVHTASQYVLLEDDPRNYSAVVQQITRSPKSGGIFKNISIANGSAGTNIAKLWKGEHGAFIGKPKIITPWDWNPVAKISRKLHYRAFEFTPNKYKLGEEISLEGIFSSREIKHEYIMLHKLQVKDFVIYLSRCKN